MVVGQRIHIAEVVIDQLEQIDERWAECLANAAAVADIENAQNFLPSSLRVPELGRLQIEIHALKFLPVRVSHGISGRIILPFPIRRSNCGTPSFAGEHTSGDIYRALDTQTRLCRRTVLSLGDFKNCQQISPGMMYRHTKGVSWLDPKLLSPLMKVH
jgi:hypothetical protein